MKNKIRENKCKIAAAALLTLWLATTIAAQSGGGYTINQSVIASGGGQNSTGGNFAADGATGQSAAGTRVSGGSYAVSGGFWGVAPPAPTAAMGSGSGRVFTADGQGIRNVSVKLTDSNGLVRSTQTAGFGYFRFETVEVGQIYILEISSRKFTFAGPTRVLSVQDEIAGLEFIAEPQ